MNRVLLLAGLLALLAGCANQKNISDESLAQANFQADVGAMKSRIQELRMRVEELEAKTGGKNADLTLEDVNARLARLEETVARMAQSLSLDVGQRSPGAPAAPAAASSALSDATDAGDAARPDTGRSDLGRTDTGRVDADRFADTGRPAAETAPSPAYNAPRAADSPAEGVYNMGMEAYNARDYSRAAGLFAEMQKAYPSDRLVPSAMFWQADSLLQQGDFARTALICQDLIQKYPSNPIVASAMLKQAQAFKRLGRDQAAKIVMQDVVKRFPGTAEAKSAQAQLGGMR